MEFGIIACVTKKVNQNKIVCRSSLFVRQTFCCLKTFFVLRHLTQLTAFFSGRSKNLSIGKYFQRCIIFNINSMTYRIHHTVKDKILSFNADILKLHSKTWLIREISLSLEDMFAELHRHTKAFAKRIDN